MKVFHKYIFQEYIKLFILCMIIFLSIYLLIDFLQRIDNFIESNVSKGIILSYFLYKIPLILVQMIPVGSLISVIILFSLMKKNNEIVALKTCGLDILRLSGIMITISLFIGIVTFLLSEVIVPYTSSRSNEIWNTDVEKYNPGRFFGINQIWYKSQNSIYWIRHFDSQKNTMESPTFYFFDDAFRLIKRIDGKRAVWIGGLWKIEGGIIQERIADDNYALSKFEELFLEMPETPKTFIRGIKRPEDMSYQQLRHYAKKVGQEGYDNTRYLIDMHFKFSHPFISLILALIGIPIALWVKKGGTPLAVSIGVGICFILMAAMGFSRSFGIAGILPPILSAWVANLIFLLFAVFLLIRLER